MTSVWDKDFEDFREEYLLNQSRDKDFIAISQEWLNQSMKNKFTYQFNWLGIPIIQMPSDLIVFQEIVYNTKPDLIIETGVARGGSVNFWASMQDICGLNGRVIGIDIDIRNHTKNAIQHSKYSDRIILVESNSIDSNIKNKIDDIAKMHQNIMVILDSNHTHEHVYQELLIYARYVSVGCYLIVLDTMTEFVDKPVDRPWGPGDNPYTAVNEFMRDNGSFVKDLKYENISLTTLAPSGFWLKKT